MADATVTSNPFEIVQLPKEGNLWYVSEYSATWATVGVVLAGVAGKSHYITHISVRTATATTVTIGYDGSGTDAVTNKCFGPIPFDAASGFFPWKAPLGFGLKCGSGLEITLETADAAPLWLEMWGKTCKDNLFA